ncbi:MAG: transcription termination/antitermination factor NusG [Bacteroidetes bacterium]|nr:transcription termination/antitermination factor NusG [Bacteroidota bacterium]
METPENVSEEKTEKEEEVARPDNTKWFTIRVYSGQEQKVKDHIQSELNIHGVQDKVFRIMIPSETIIEMKNGKKKEKTRSFLPGYMIVEMVDDKVVQHVISNTPGVVNFVGPKNTPQALRPDEVDRMLGRMHEKRTTEVFEIPFKVGDHIRVTDGPFTDFTGYIDEINYEKNKLKVMVSIFGRSTPVELDFLQVKLEQ